VTKKTKLLRALNGDIKLMIEEYPINRTIHKEINEFLEEANKFDEINLDLYKAANSLFNEKEWVVRTQLNKNCNKIKFIMVRENADGSRDVITKKNKICHIPAGGIVDSKCGAYAVIDINKIGGNNKLKAIAILSTKNEELLEICDKKDKNE